MARPPLDLTLEVENIDGSGQQAFPVSRDEVDGAARLGTMTTKLQTGFESLAANLFRDPRKTYDSPRIMQTARVVGYGGTRWEGGITSVPNTRADQLGATGYWDLTQDNAGVSEIYISQDFGKWGEMPLAEQARILAAAYAVNAYSWSNAGEALIVSPPAQAIPASHSGLWFIGPPGTTIGKIVYNGTEASLGGWTAAQIVYSVDDYHNFATDDDDTVTLDGTQRTSTPASTSAYRSAWIYLANSIPGTPTAGCYRKYTQLAVYGNHGLDSINPATVFKHVIGKYCPLLTADDTTVYAFTDEISELVFAGAKVKDVLERVNAWVLGEIAVWEGRKAWLQPARSRSDYDYLLSEFVGDTLDRAPAAVDDDEPCNGVWTYYTDALTGRESRVGPLGTGAEFDADGDALLLWTDSNNPCVREGRNRFPILQMSRNVTRADAITMGALWLEERQYNMYAGTGSAGPYVRNRAGQWVPSSMIRSGDRVKYVGNEAIRRVYSTSVDPRTFRNGLTFEKPPSTVAGIMERQEIAFQARNLS